MRVGQALGQVWSDLTALFPRDGRRFWFLFVAAIVLQAGFWYLAGPGPRLLALEPRLPENAMQAVLWTVTFLFAIPFMLARSLGFRPKDARAGAGRAKLGIPVVLVMGVAVMPLLFFAASDRAIQLTYPWPGAWAGASAGNLALWSGTYLLYFVAFEYFYRGFLFRLVEEQWGTPSGLWIQAMAATLIALGRPLPVLLASLPVSLLLGVLFVRSRSLLYPIVLHWLIAIGTDVFSLYHQKLLVP